MKLFSNRINTKVDMKNIIYSNSTNTIFRSKLKEKTKKVDMLRLKKALALDSSYQEADFSSSFFDD